jgi:HlyD family secretion protein
MTRKIRRILILLVIVVLVVIAILYFSREEPLAVVIQKVESGRVESTVANTRAGTVKACRRAGLAPTTGGQIAKLLVHEGDQVQADQVLLELWNDDLAAQLALAKSEAAASKAQAVQACLVADEAERNADRQQKLFSKQLTSVENVDQAQTNAKAQRANCDAAQATANVSKSRVAVAQATLDRTILRAPFAGTVAKINGELFEFVTPSPVGVITPPAVDLIDDSCLYISAPMDEVDAPDIKPGMDARISLDAFAGKTFPGIVQRIAPYVLEVEKQARTVDVETVFANPADFKRMLPGYSADVEVILDVHKDVLRIPSEAILEGNRVLVFKGDGAPLEERKIETGLSNWKFTEIISGLAAGEEIVTSIDREGVKAGVPARAEKNNGTQGLPDK